MSAIKIPEKRIPRREHRALRITGNVLLIITLLLFVWLTGGAVAYGWIIHANSYGAAFAEYGRCYFAAAGIMTLGTVLYYLRRDLPAAAEENGWAGQTEQSFARTAASVWRDGMMWDFVPLILLLLLTLTRFFSYDASVKRAEKRAAREQAENASAPSILADDADFGERHSTASADTRQDSAEPDRTHR